MSADAKIPYQNPSVTSSNLAAQQVTNDNGDPVLVEVVSLAAEGVHSGGPVINNTPGTPVPLGFTTPCKHVTIQALGPNYQGIGGNNGWVWVGGSGVNAASKVGVYLPPGASYELDINDIAKVFFDVDVAGDKVTFNYML